MKGNWSVMRKHPDVPELMLTFVQRPTGIDTTVTIYMVGCTASDPFESARFFIIPSALKGCSASKKLPCMAGDGDAARLDDARRGKENEGTSSATSPGEMIISFFFGVSEAAFGILGSILNYIRNSVLIFMG